MSVSFVLYNAFFYVRNAILSLYTSVYSKLLPKNTQFHVIKIVTNSGTYKRLIPYNYINSEECCSISIVDNPTDWVINDITIVDTDGLEYSRYKLLRPYFGPDGNLWVNTIPGLEHVVQEPIKFVTVILQNTVTKELKTLEFDENSPIFIGVF